ncbi:MAG TPA: tyrosine--tRNA ligase, partial [Thermomicrobiales bacterium]|nr:tyrosine--tRNA ligase [Thermomicrobiales bacterium]
MVDTTTRPAPDAAAERDRNVYDVLAERGFIAQVSDEAGLRAALAQPLTLYCGYDPTATSLHIGNLLTLMMLAHCQRHGHRPIALLGGGTGMIGDPTDRAAQRPIMTVEQIGANIAALRPIFARYLDFEGDAGGGVQPALLVNNADWLLELRYIPFLRDIGIYFSVNQLLSHSTYRERLESEGTGLNFIELNYALLQGYDFLHLHRAHGCALQVGGNDQWFNILAGTELIRRADGGRAFALVAPLLTTASGEKMGKTASGERIWLDPAQTSPYDFYQYWINVPDDRVAQLMKLFTFLPLDEIAALTSAAGADIRRAKEVLAFEATRITHGEAEARDAQAAARALFGAARGTLSGRATLTVGEPTGTARGEVTRSTSTELSAILSSNVPTTTVPRADLEAGVPVLDLFVAAGLAKSRGEARRLVAQGGAYLNGEPVADPDRRVAAAALADGALLLRA